MNLLTFPFMVLPLKKTAASKITEMFIIESFFI